MSDEIEASLTEADLIDQVYETLRSPERWSAVVSNIGVWLGADSGMMMTPALPGAAPVMLHVYGLVVTAIMPAYLKYAGRAEFSNRALATGRVPGAFLFDELMPPAEQAQNAYWQEVVAPLGFSSGVFSMVRTPDEGTPVILNYYRKPPREPFTEADVAKVEALLPHLRRALSITLDSTAATMLPAEAKDLNETIGLPCFLLGGDGAIVHQNSAALALAIDSDDMRVENGQVKLVDVEAQALLQAAVQRLVAEPWSGRYRVGAEILARRKSAQTAFIVVVTPVGSATPFVAISSPVRCAVMILEERLSSTDAIRERLRRLYGLTDAEIAVAIDLASGDTPAEIALRRSASLETVRFQIKRVMSKTGTHRQGELVGLVNRLRF